jgi:O-antigen/teichoic acid export membrane protein
MMQYMDRLLVGMLLSLSAVAYYATPYEVATKMLIFPGAIVGVLFPAFSTALVADRGYAGKLFRRAVKYVVLALFPLTLLIVLYAQNGLGIWLGPTFASHSTRALQWLAIGAFANGIASLAFAIVQGAGRADITGKLHLLELPFYVMTVWGLTVHFGIEGTAIAWAARAIIDGILLFLAASRYVDGSVPLRSIFAAVAVVTTVFTLAMIGMSLLEKIVVSVIVLLSFVATAWFGVLGADERTALQGLRTRLLPSRLRTEPKKA